MSESPHSLRPADTDDSAFPLITPATIDAEEPAHV